MNRKRALVTFALAVMAIALVPVATAVGSDSSRGETQTAVEAVTALGTGFTYQGKLTDGGNPANGSYDLRFVLYDADVAGVAIGNTVTKTSVAVTNGLFTVDLDFGTITATVTATPTGTPTVTATPTSLPASAVFDGNARWLEIAVRPGGTSGTFVTLSPRQPISAVPYAFYAKAAGGFAVPLTASGANSGSVGALDITQTGTGMGIAGRRTTTDASIIPGAAGVYGSNAGNGAGVQGESTFASGVGVQGFATGATGVGGKFTGPTALELDGLLKVSGTSKTAFTVVVTVGVNTTCDLNRGVILDSPLINADPNALLFITSVDSTPSTLTDIPAVGLVYNPTGCAGATNKWVVYNGSAAGLPDTLRLNVLVIKQ